MNGTTEAALYLWEKAEKHELLNGVCQQLVEGVGIEAANIDMYLTGKHINRKRSNKESVVSGKNNEKEKIAIRLTESVKKSKKLETQKLLLQTKEIWFTQISNKDNDVEGTTIYEHRPKYIKMLEDQIASLQAQLDYEDIDDIAKDLEN